MTRMLAALGLALVVLPFSATRYAKCDTGITLVLHMKNHVTVNQNVRLWGKVKHTKAESVDVMVDTGGRGRPMISPMNPNNIEFNFQAPAYPTTMTVRVTVSGNDPDAGSFTLSETITLEVRPQEE